MILCYITCKDKTEAKKIANTLMKEKLIACANIFPIESLYCWKNKLCNDKEIVLIAKSQDKHWTKIKKKVKELHSYKIPCILKIKAEANQAFNTWLKKETG